MPPYQVDATEGHKMNHNEVDTRSEKSAFEPSLLVEYGDAGQMTEAKPGPGNQIDGPNYTS
jgi:hypothetical protein